jgi:hypothetical protein
MPLQLPNLDDRRYKDLVEEGRSLIPTYSPEWTNHNPSDPGITLVELFAYLTEMMIYRLDRVTDENRKKFLKLLSGPEWTPGRDLISDTRAAVRKIREIYRAVTCDDHEKLVVEHFDQIKRAHCIAGKNLEAGTESGRLQEKPGHLSVMIVPGEQWAGTGKLGPSPTPEQLQEVWAYLDERRILTTRHHVVGPLYAPVVVEAVIIRRTDTSAGAVIERAVGQLEEFLNPLPSGNKAGWPFGRDVYVSEVCEELEKIDGIDYIADLMLLSSCGSGAQGCVPAQSIWHDQGDLIGLEITDHVLPGAAVSGDGIVVVPPSQVLVVNVTVEGALSPSVDPASAKRRIKQATRAFFHPLYDGPRQDSTSAKELKMADLTSRLASTGDFQQVDSITMRTDPLCYLYESDGKVSGVKAEAGIIIDARLRLNV